MPTYEYACKSCGEHLEVVQSFKDEALSTCPNCGGDLRKVFGSIGIAFKGSGFYKTDSRSGAKGGKKKEPASEKVSSDASSSSSSSGASSSSSGASGSSSGSSGSSGSDSSSTKKSDSGSSGSKAATG
jgi:putative FmdB family regulatory protein